MNAQKIALQLASQEAKMGGALAPILGQYGVNIMKFCKTFNELSIIYQKGLMLRVSLEILTADKFNIVLKGPSSTLLFKLYQVKSTISLLDLYKIALIKSKDGDIASLHSITKNLLATLSSTNYTLK